MISTPEPHVLYDDTWFKVWLPGGHDEEARKLFLSIGSALRRMGFTVGPCEDTRQHFPTLAKSRRRGRHGDLWVKLGHSGRTVDITFFQDRVIDNPNGNEYDFDKFEKLPYPLRLRFLLTRRKVLARLAAKGIPAIDRGWRSDRDPLDAFNDGWGADRFRRGPDGWPDESELKSWRRTDCDGQTIHQGEFRYVEIQWRWCRVQVYGGINGMWHGYAGGRFASNDNASAYRSVFPGRGRMVPPRVARGRLESSIQRAVKDRDYLRAAKMDAALRASQAEPEMAGCGKGGRP